VVTILGGLLILAVLAGFVGALSGLGGGNNVLASIR
jgi:hypothetical protein